MKWWLYPIRRSLLAINVIPIYILLEIQRYLDPARSSILNSHMMLLKYPLSLLLFTHFLVFPRWGFSQSESINPCNTTSLAMSAILSYWMNGLLNFWTLELWMRHVGMKCVNENIGFHMIPEIPYKVSSNTNIKRWMKCWMHLHRA